MRIKVQVMIESEQGEVEVIQDVAQLERAALQPETLGLSLAEAKGLLQRVQQTLAEQQVAKYHQQQSTCQDCGQRRRRKGDRSIVYQTLFGKLHLRSTRLFHCACHPQTTCTFSPLSDLLRDRTAPERLYLESKFASLMSYGLTTKLLEEVLPLEGEVNAVTVRNHLHQVAQRLEGELGEEQAMFADGCEQEWAKLPRPDLPLTVGLDGGYVHSSEPRSRKDSWFEVIVGKSVTAEGASKCFGLVNGYDRKPKRRLFEVLKSQGMQMNQQVTFLSDGGDTVRDLQLYLNPQAEHLLDWFHITMRLTVMNQMAKGLRAKEFDLHSLALKDLERIKWYLWHGNVFRALQIIEDLNILLDDDEPSLEQRKLLKAIREFQTYIENNSTFIPNYGERWHYGETISTAFVESTVNQVISKRMVKKQQMRWSRRGAHLLLQVRTRVLNQELCASFRRWYSRFETENKN
jgi:hypothetical protein